MTTITALIVDGSSVNVKRLLWIGHFTSHIAP